MRAHRLARNCVRSCQSDGAHTGMRLHVQGSGASAAAVRAHGGREPAGRPSGVLESTPHLAHACLCPHALQARRASAAPPCGRVFLPRSGRADRRRQRVLAATSQEEVCAAPVAARMPVVARSSCAAEHEQQKPWLAGTRAPAASSTNPQVGLADAGPSSQAVSVLPPMRTSSCAALGAGLRHGRTPSWPAAVLACCPDRLPRHPVAIGMLQGNALQQVGPLAKSSPCSRL